MNLRANYAQTTTEKMLACAREIAEITATTQAEFGKLVGEQLTSGSQDMFEAMQKMFKGMPISDQTPWAPCRPRWTPRARLSSR